jgi:anti-sigma regulatory factor (Ser/Thr protein kinase)
VAEEVLTNVANHGDAVAAREARIGLSLGFGEVSLQFTDEGRPFDPLAAPPPDLEAPAAERPIGGLGIHLVRSLVDAIAYARVGSQNVLTVRKRVGAPR